MTTSELRAICQKGAGEPYTMSRYFYRPMSIYLTKLYIVCNASSNSVTFQSLLAGLVAVGFSLSREAWALPLVALFLQLYYLLDHVDGEVARYNTLVRHKPSNLSGTFFDLWVHLHSVNLVFAAIGLTLFRETGNLLWPILGILSCNISGSYQRMALCTVLLNALGSREIHIGDCRFAGLIGIPADRNGGSPPKRNSAWKRIFLWGSQWIVFPGSIFGITVACLGDFLLATAYPAVPPILFRCTYLCVHAAAGLLSKIYRTHATIRELREIDL